MDVLAARGRKRAGNRRGANVKGEDNVISNGSGIVVNRGQAAVIIDNGRIAEFCAVEGQYTYDQSSEPSLFFGDLGKNLKGTLKSTIERFKYGGVPGKDQRVYYFNTKEIMGNKYGTPSPIPYLVSDQRTGLRLTVSLRANGEYSYKLADPVLFYTNVCGNVAYEYNRSEIDSQLKTEVITALGPALQRLGGIEYHEISFRTSELSGIFNEVLSAKWREKRGIEVVSFGITCTAAPEDEAKIKKFQESLALGGNAALSAGHIVSAQADAMRGAANNEGGMGAMGAFMGLGLASQAGGANAQALFQAAGQAASPANMAGWVCVCGHQGNAGKFCAECGKQKPVTGALWNCACGRAENNGNFCSECGKPKPVDGFWDCDCGYKGNPGKFCAGCGKPRA
jgi:membrane protease subunit (stomatin/prohibitin family)